MEDKHYIVFLKGTHINGNKEGRHVTLKVSGETEEQRLETLDKAVKENLLNDMMYGVTYTEYEVQPVQTLDIE